MNNIHAHCTYNTMYKEANQANIIGSLANNTLDLIIWWSTSGALLLVFD